MSLPREGLVKKTRSCIPESSLEFQSAYEAVPVEMRFVLRFHTADWIGA